MKKLTITLCTITLALLFNSAKANTITFNSFYTSNGDQHGTGLFTGSDTNNDGLLTYSELTNFNYNGVGAFSSTEYAFWDLLDIGEFNLLTNSWAANGLSASFHTPNSGYFATNGTFGVAALSSDYFTIEITSPPVSAVPEPSTYVLMLGGLGLIGYITTRRKTHKKST